MRGAPVGAVRSLLGAPPIERSIAVIAFRAHDRALEYTHAFVVAFTRDRFRGALAQSLSLAAYELLDNALNFGSVLGEVVFEVVDNTKTGGGVAIRVSNDTVQVRVDMLRAHVERVAKDPEGTFLEQMRRSAGGVGTRPMLGIARVVHEGKLHLHVYIEGTRVTVIARGEL